MAKDDHKLFCIQMIDFIDLTLAIYQSCAGAPGVDLYERVNDYEPFVKLKAAIDELAEDIEYNSNATLQEDNKVDLVRYTELVNELERMLNYDP